MDLVFHTITNGNKDRITSTKKSFNKYNLSSIFFYFEKHKTNGKLGCFLSHINILKYAKKHDMEYICITEDNLIYNHHTIKTISKHITQFITTNSTWNILILGGWYIPFSTVENTIYPSIYKTRSIHGTSCYIIHKRFYTKIIEDYKNHTDEHIDAYLMRTAQPQAYIVYPLLFRRNNFIPTTNSYFSNEIVNGYYYIAFSKKVHKWIEYFATNQFLLWLVSCGIIILFLSLWLLNKKY